MIIHPFLIKRGGEEPVGQGHKVTFYDYDGKRMKTDFVETGDTATPPITPNYSLPTEERPALIFQTWNNSIYGVNRDIDIGAIYKTADGKTYMYITLNVITGNNIILKINKTDTSTLTVDWGDGTSETNNSSGDITLTHTFSSDGDYVITSWISNGRGYYKLGDGINGSNLFGGDTNMSASLRKIFVGDKVTAFQGFAFDGCLNLKTMTSPTLNNVWTRYAFRGTGFEFVILPVLATTIDSGLFSNCYLLKQAIIPNSYNLIKSSCFANNYCLQPKLPTELKTIEDGCWSNNKNIREIIIPERVSTMRTLVFSQNTNLLKIIFLSTIVPTFYDINMFTGINPLCKIYVPDNSIQAYKTAPYMSHYADYIYPLSELVEVE